MKLISTTLLLTLAAVSPAAAQNQGTVTSRSVVGPVTYGPGHKVCSDWSLAETKTDPSEYVGNRFFVAGVMSAYNIFVSPRGFDIGRGLTPNDMKSYMHTWCAAHPTETIAIAATAFITMLKARQTR